ncbi:hypothetical protein BY996DRAFT_7987354 [Phakopsora pachyrhizi]|nr:hypothetical protein BY996DRAFT_7987354 [Phakopsora pachyrhizi]
MLNYVKGYMKYVIKQYSSNQIHLVILYQNFIIFIIQETEKLRINFENERLMIMSISFLFVIMITELKLF